MIRKIVFVGFGIVSLALASGLLSNSASAAGPDRDSSYLDVRNGSYGENTRPQGSYAVSRDGFTNIGTTTIKVYVPRNDTSTRITINSPGMCINSARGINNGFDQYFPEGPPPRNGGGAVLATTYTITSGSNNVATRRGYWSYASTCENLALPVTLTNGQLDRDTGMRVYTIRANVNYVGYRLVNLFWLDSSEPGVIFSQSTDGGPRDFGYQLSSPIPPAGSTRDVYYNMDQLFGSDCSVTSAVTRIIEIYDDDNDGNDESVQPRPFNVQLREFTRGENSDNRGNGTPLALTRVNDANTHLTNLGGRWYHPYTETSGDTVRFSFTARPDRVYRLYFRNIYFNNTLQFALPFETIYGYIGCQDSDLRGFTSQPQPSGTILPGGSATWDHRLTNRSRIGYASGVEARMHQSIQRGNGSYEVRDQVVGSALINGGEMRPGDVVSGSNRFEASADDVGKTICQWLVWTSNAGDNGSTSRSASCAVVGKRPTLQVWGGDTRINGDVRTSSTEVDGQLYGSWVEYGALIAGRNQGNRFGSGASLAGGATSPSRDGNEFTFANVGVAGNYGQYGSLGSPNERLARAMAELNVGGTNTIGNANLGSLASGRYTASGNINLRGSVGSNRTIIIDARGHTVTINGNINYSAASYASIDQLPQVVIIADTININQNITNIDAWLIATSGSGGAMIDTCRNHTNVSITICRNPLTVNGPVASDEAEFKRTAGFDDAARAGDPAERLNLRADAHLWLYSEARRSVIPQTVQVTELPPRY